MKSNNYRIFEEDSFFVRTPIHSNVINMENSYCSRIMTKFNFKVLNVDIVFFFVKNADWPFAFVEGAQWWNKTPYDSLTGEVFILKKVF